MKPFNILKKLWKRDTSSVKKLQPSLEQINEQYTFTKDELQKVINPNLPDGELKASATEIISSIDAIYSTYIIPKLSKKKVSSADINDLQLLVEVLTRTKSCLITPSEQDISHFSATIDKIAKRPPLHPILQPLYNFFVSAKNLKKQELKSLGTKLHALLKPQNLFSKPKASKKDYSTVENSSHDLNKDQLKVLESCILHYKKLQEKLDEILKKSDRNSANKDLKVAAQSICSAAEGSFQQNILPIIKNNHDKNYGEATKDFNLLKEVLEHTKICIEAPVNQANITKFSEISTRISSRPSLQSLATVLPMFKTALDNAHVSVLQAAGKNFDAEILQQKINSTNKTTIAQKTPDHIPETSKKADKPVSLLSKCLKSPAASPSPSYGGCMH